MADNYIIRGTIETVNNGGAKLSGGLTGTTATMSGQIISTIPNPSAPFVVSSTALNINLNADLLDGHQLTDITGFTNDNYVSVSGDTMTGSLTAPSFVKNGGTNTQFLKADGSVDSNTYVVTGRTVSAGSGLTGGGNLSTNISLSHANTSDVLDLFSTGNTGGIVLRDIYLTYDDFGHTTFSNIETYDLDNRYYTETESDSRFLSVDGDTINGNLNIIGDLSVSNKIFDSNNSSGLNGQYLKTVGTGTTWNQIIISDVQNLQTELNNRSDITHKHYQLYQPNNTNAFVYTDNGGNLHVDGNIVQSGSTYETHTEQIYTKDDYIYLREGAVGGLGSSEYTGIEAIKYDGINNGRLVFDNVGTARVGDVGFEQPLTTRDEIPAMLNEALVYWDGVSNKIKTSNLTIGDIDERYVNTSGDTMTGSLTASSLIKIGGLPSQFLKADGSVDSSTYVPSGRTITAGSGLIGGGNLSSDITISHADISSVVNINSNNSNGVVIQDMSFDFDAFGHVSGATVGTYDLDNRYYTQSQSDTRFVNVDGDTMSSNLQMLNSGIITDFTSYNTGSTSTIYPGVRRWNDVYGTSELRLKGNNVTVQDGFEVLGLGYNNSNSVIYNGTPLTSIGGYNSANIIIPAIASGGTHSHHIVCGVATEDIQPFSFGYYTKIGEINQLNLSTFNINETVYLSQIVPGSYAKAADLEISGRYVVIGKVLDNSSTVGILSLDITNEVVIANNTEGELETFAANNTSTGVFQFGGITKTSNTTFSVSPAKGWIVDNETNPIKPSIKYVEYPGAINLTTPYLNTNTITYILLDSNGDLSFQPTVPTPSDRREKIYLGKIGHPDKTSLSIAFQVTDSMISPLSQVRDMFIPTPLINSDVYPYFSNSLTLFNTSGNLYGLGINFPSENKNPNSIFINASDPITGRTFQYRTQIGGNYAFRTTIDPSSWDNAGVVTAITPPEKKSTNQRIYLLQDGSFRVQYGQKTYSDLNAAKLAINGETFITFPNFKDNGMLIGILSVTSDATDLSNPLQAQLFLASKFGEIVGATGGGGAGTSATLQLAYDNSITPEIVTNDNLKAVSIRRGSSSDSDNLIEFLNSSGNVQAYVKGNGVIGTTNQIISTITGATSPLSIASTTLNTNLNADLLDGQHGAYYAPASSLDNYLELGGGTLTGPLVIDSVTSGSTLFAVLGSSNEIFAINDISDGPLLEVTSQNGVSLLKIDTSGAIIRNSGSATNVNSGSNVIYQVEKTKGSALFCKFRIKNPTTNAYRAGELIAVYDVTNSRIEYTETGTNDLFASTNGISLSVVLNGSYVQIIATVVTGTWDIKLACELI